MLLPTTRTFGGEGCFNAYTSSFYSILISHTVDTSDNLFLERSSEVSSYVSIYILCIIAHISWLNNNKTLIIIDGCLYNDHDTSLDLN